jgi:GNAT superfamily N-acetyltransferase
MSQHGSLPELTIEPARESDVATVLAFIRDLAQYERLSDEVVATGEDLRRALFGPRPSAEVLIARLSDEPVGFALFFHNFSTFLARHGLYLEDVYVLPEHRGRGVGRTLLQRVAKLAVDRGCGRVEWAVLDWNEPAIRFYRDLGAIPMSDWTVFRLAGEALARAAGNRA